MQEGFVPDAVVANKLDKSRAELFSYIEKNTDYIENNYPVFFGKVASIFDQMNVPVPDQAHDEFIDAVTYKIFDVTSRADDTKFVARLCEIACGIKRKKEKKAGVHLAAAVKLMKIGRYLEASTFLKPYWKHDVSVGCWYAYCFYALYKEGSQEQGFSSSERWNYLKRARQHLEELAQWKPPLHRLVKGEIRSDTWLDEPFWMMIFSATEWFPENRWYLQTGFAKAKADANEVVLVKMLQVALVRFPDDMLFFREAYRMRFEQAELSDALGLVRAMREKFPDDLEPIYYGIRTAFYLSGDAEFNEFRNLAVEKGMAGHVLAVADFAHAYLRGKQNQALLCLGDFKRKYPSLQYYADLLEFVVADCSGTVDGSRQVVFRSVDNYCIRMIGIKDL